MGLLVPAALLSRLLVIASPLCHNPVSPCVAPSPGPSPKDDVFAASRFPKLTRPGYK